MVRHIVWWTLPEEAHGHTAAEHIAHIKEVGMGLMGKIPGLLSIEISSDFVITPTVDVHVILTSTHTDAAALKVYADHPEHVKLAEYIGKIRLSRQAIDYQL